MFKKNRTLSVVGLAFAMTSAIWFDKPWLGELTIGQQLTIAINLVTGIIAIILLIKSLRDGTYGK